MMMHVLARLFVVIGSTVPFTTAFLARPTQSRSSFLSAVRRARDLMQSLMEDEQCFSTETGVRALGDVCAYNVVFDDRFEPKPFVGKSAVMQHLYDRITQKQGKGRVRLDKISDGDEACGFLWTWIARDNQNNNNNNEEEGLRGTTFVQLNVKGEIEYMTEFPEPLFKPGDLTKDLLKALTAGEEWHKFQPITEKNPTMANELVKYLFDDLQKADPLTAHESMMRFWSDRVVYHDMNFEQPMQGPSQVKQFTQDFSFPGITFQPLLYDDGVDSCCFTWQVILGDIPDSIQGISFYELDPVSRQIIFVRDIAESAIKPPILGKLARQLRPGLGVFRGVPSGSRSK